MKHKKRMETGKLRLQDKHTWKAPNGYKIVVIDRGAVSFNIPQDWVVAKLEPFELNDRLPPHDDARISTSFWRLPPGVDWSGLPLAPLLTKSVEGSSMEILARGGVIKSTRTDIELVWTEHRFIDPKEKREAFSRFALARGFDVQAFISCDFWVDDALRLHPIWDEVLRSLQLGRVIQDPTKGAVLH
ncbi:MAG: hypothetical protein K8L97_10515 [Anaerolineae bacterium]|nr:hypothetical protein [Anaerolineae bacterium]